MSFVRETAEGLIIQVYIQPRASKNQVAGLHDGAVKLRLTAPPVDNAANRLCVQFLAKKLGVAKSALAVVSGRSSRRKSILCRWPEGAGEDRKAAIRGKVENIAAGPEKGSIFLRNGEKRA